MSEFTSTEWAEVVRLREEEFVLAQQCIYVDADAADAYAMHFCCYEDDLLIGYLRMVSKPMNKFSIGRIITKHNRRNQGIARRLIVAAIGSIDPTTATISMSAQVYLTSFYRKLNFKEVGKMYLEDGIPHIQMTYQMT